MKLLSDEEWKSISEFIDLEMAVRGAGERQQYIRDILDTLPEVQVVEVEDAQRCKFGERVYGKHGTIYCEELSRKSGISAILCNGIDSTDCPLPILIKKKE